MKNKLTLFFLLGAVGCSPSPTKIEATTPADNPIHSAVSVYLKRTLDDPASYQPAHWSHITPYQQREVDATNAREESAQMKHLLNLAEMENQSYIRLIDIPADKKTLAQVHKAALTFIHRADSVKLIINKLDASTDTTRLGQSLWHAFRAKNKMGALVLDSARFVVSKEGAVTVLLN